MLTEVSMMASMSLNLRVCTPPYKKIPGVCATDGVTLADRSKPFRTIDAPRRLRSGDQRAPARMLILGSRRSRFR